MMDVDYDDDLGLLTKTFGQVKSLPHSLEQVATYDIGLYVNAKKEFMYFKLGRSHLFFKRQAAEIDRPVLISLLHCLFN